MVEREGDKIDLKELEVEKLQQHLNLLKNEYRKLQCHTNELEKKYALACTANGVNNNGDNNYLSLLLKTIHGLYDNPLFSDMKILLADGEYYGHKIILSARTTYWGNMGAELSPITELDWTNLSKEVGVALLKWIYTDTVDFISGENFVLELIQTAHLFEFKDLVSKCEKALLSEVNVKNCIRFYTTAQALNAESLKQHCSSLITTHWDDFTSDDFSDMVAPLLHQVLKNKTKYPLHSAVRLHREDVVLLLLVENDSQVGTFVNQLDKKGEIALDIALKDRQMGIARMLIEHGADPDCKDLKGWTMLHRSVERGDSYAAHFLIEKGASVSMVTPDQGDTALHLIASSSPYTNDDAECNVMDGVAKSILDKKLDVNLQNNKGFTALHLAVMSGNENVFDLLLNGEIRIDLNVRTWEGHTPLYFALLSGNDAFFNKLIQFGAQPNPIYANTSDSLLHVISRDGLEEAALFICSHSNNLNHTNKKGETALHVACDVGLDKLVTRLLECEANPNIQTLPPDEIITNGDNSDVIPVYRLTPIMVAIRNGNADCVTALLKYNEKKRANGEAWSVNMNCVDSRGDNVLSLAVQHNLQFMLADLIKGGADINKKDGRGYTLLHQAILKSDVDTVKFLLGQGSNLDTRTQDNKTSLQLAINVDAKDIVEELCKRGIDMYVLDEASNCPLWSALENGKEDIASILVKYGVDTDFWSDGPDGCKQTLLHRAIDQNNEAVANFLVRGGCDINAVRQPGEDNRGGDEAFDLQTPLHLCCQWGLESVVRTLLEHGADVNAQDADGKTALHVAVQNQHAAIIALLLSHPEIDASLSLRDKSGMTVFASALTSRNHRAAQAILRKLPTCAEQFNQRGRNFLHTAIQNGDVESVVFLLSICVDVNSRVQDANQTPPLHLAAQLGNEMLVRSFILAGARVDDRDSLGRTALHVASACGHSAVVSALLQNNIDFSATDRDGCNALHVACREGFLTTVQALLSESEIDAEDFDNRGRNPLHILARYGKENVAAICDLFLQTMPDYPLEKMDVDGNTPLLLAYINGNGNLCRTLVNSGARVSAMNKEGQTIFNYPVATKQLLHGILDQLNKEPSWAEGDDCQECLLKFKFTTRKHHCRHCGRLLCKDCASKEIPILKYGITKPVRVCETCFNILQGSSSNNI